MQTSGIFELKHGASNNHWLLRLFVESDCSANDLGVELNIIIHQ